MDRLINKLTQNIADDPDQGTFYDLTVRKFYTGFRRSKKIDMENNTTSFNRTSTSQITFKDDFSTISDPVAGCIAYDKNNDTLKIYTGNSWEDVGGNITIDGGDIQGALEVDSFKVKAGNLTVVNNGNLGIGKSNPSEKIDVVGNIKASGNIHADKLKADNDIEGKNLTIDETIQGKNLTIDETIQGEKLIATDKIETKNLNITGDVKIYNENVELVNVNDKGQITHQSTKTDVLQETLFDYINDEPVGLIYLAFENPDNLGLDHGTNEWHAEGITGNLEYVPSVTDNSGKTIKNVARFSGSQRINLDNHADNDYRAVSCWVRTDNSGEQMRFFRIGRDANDFTHQLSTTFLTDGRIRAFLFKSTTSPIGGAFTTSGVNYADGKWHFLQLSIGSKGFRFYVDGDKMNNDFNTTQILDGPFDRKHLGFGSSDVAATENTFTGDLAEITLLFVSFRFVSRTSATIDTHTETHNTDTRSVLHPSTPTISDSPGYKKLSFLSHM